MLGTKGSIANAALLVSCPCDLVEWRKHMQQTKGGAIWERPVRSLSPTALVDSVPVSAGIWMLVGGDDQVAPPALSLAHAEALRTHGVTVDVTVCSRTRSQHIA
jgi:hypothetical protein